MTGNGHVIPGTPIAIDVWNAKSCPEVHIFLLSHFHGDHIAGLTSSWSYPIYASPVTCKLLIHKLKLDSSLVKSLEIGEDHLIPLDLEGQERMTVTLFDANHCPGSVMFLLSGYFGKILYTGDFRYKPDIFGDFQLPPINVLYLDNTYCSPKCVFPSREDAVEKILSQLHVCLVKNDHVFLGLGNLGKEDLLMQIAKETHSKICVKPTRKEVMDILGLSNIVTTDESNTKISVVPASQISGKNIELWNKKKKTHAILATARYCGFNFQPFAKYAEIHVVPFSNHSSFTELSNFVKRVKPYKIIPIIRKDVKGIFGTDISDRADMSIFQEFMCNSEPYDFIIPASVKEAMNVYQENGESSLPIKKRKVAKRILQPWQRPPSVGVRYIVSEDSETDSDPDAIHIISEKAVSVTDINDSIEEISSPQGSSSEESESDWEIIHINGRDSSKHFVVEAGT